MPAQSPLQPAKLEPPAGLALRLTASRRIGLGAVARAVDPAGRVIEPVPVPVLITVRVRWRGVHAEGAQTPCSSFIVTLHAPVPAQSPLQPAKLEPPVGFALRLTAVPRNRSRCSRPGS